MAEIDDVAVTFTSFMQLIDTSISDENKYAFIKYRKKKFNIILKNIYLIIEIQSYILKHTLHVV